MINNEVMGKASVDPFVHSQLNKTATILDLSYFRADPFANLPPSSDTFLLHLLRAIYQGGYIWGQCLICNPKLPHATLWGWRKDMHSWKPVWIPFPVISDKLPQLNLCKCKAGCRQRCSCKGHCVPLCLCRGECS